MCEFHKLCLRWRTLDNNVRIFIETQIISSLHKPAIMQKKAIGVYHKRSFEKFLITQTFSYNRFRVWMHSNYTSILLFTIVVTLIACIANASNSTIIWERTVINKVLALWPRTWPALCRPTAIWATAPAHYIEGLSFIEYLRRGDSSDSGRHYVPVGHLANGLFVTSLYQIML